MTRQRLYGRSESSFPIRFFLLVFLLSVPIWSIGPVVERALLHGLPVKLPVSSLMALVPVAGAAILSWRQGGWQAVRILLRRAFNYKRIRKKIWYVPTILLNPAVMVLQYRLTLARYRYARPGGGVGHQRANSPVPGTGS